MNCLLAIKRSLEKKRPIPNPDKCVTFTFSLLDLDAFANQQTPGMSGTAEFSEDEINRLKQTISDFKTKCSKRQLADKTKVGLQFRAPKEGKATFGILRSGFLSKTMRLREGGWPCDLDRNDLEEIEEEIKRNKGAPVVNKQVSD